jgi:creatinine amidohydrolase
MRFAEMTAPEIRALERSRVLIVAPIAACEQHSDHLPTFTDSILCGAVADRLEQAEPARVLLLPLQWLGASEHHQPLGGTLTATLANYELMLIDMISSLLNDGFLRCFVLNGHGGNIDPLRVALRRLNVRHRTAILSGAAYWELAEPDLSALCAGPRKTVGHACEIETSMMLHLRPELVRWDRVRNDPSEPPEGLAALFLARDFEQRTDHGAVGYPEFASAAKGEHMLEAIVSRVVIVARRLLGLQLPE